MLKPAFLLKATRPLLRQRHRPEAALPPPAPSLPLQRLRLPQTPTSLTNPLPTPRPAIGPKPIASSARAGKRRTRIGSARRSPLIDPPPSLIPPILRRTTISVLPP